MNTVSFDGVEYVKAAVVAKDFRYTADYVGQLCRAKKVNARMIGRTWFVQVESVLKHKQARHAVTSKNKSSKTSTEKVVSKVNVANVSVTKSIKEMPQKTQLEFSVATIIPVSYQPDEEALLPQLTKRHFLPPKNLPINLAEAKQLKVANRSKSSSFKATEMPSVVLSGELSVGSYVTEGKIKEPQESSDSLENKDITSSLVIDEKYDSSKKTLPTEVAEPAKVKVNKKPKAVAGIKKLKVKLVGKKSALIKTIAAKTILKVNKLDSSKVSVDKVPTKVSQSKNPSSYSPQSIQTNQLSEDIPQLVSLSPLIATVAALLVVVLLAATSSLVTTSQLAEGSQVVVQVSTLLQYLLP